MARHIYRGYPGIPTGCISATLLSLILMTTSTEVLAHGGHGNEFQAGSQSAASVGAIQVDATTARRMGLKVVPVSRQHLAVGLKTTGQIETLPNQQVEVTTPVGGTVIRLLVRPGEVVEAGQPVAIMTSPELAELRTTALDRRAEAIAAVQQAQADLRLAQDNYQQQQKITATEIQQARTELSFAQERYQKDQELLARGAIARRTFLESETQLAAAKANLTKAESRLQISAAAAQLKRAQSSVAVAQSRVTLSGETYQTRLRQLEANPNQDGTLTIKAPISGTVADREATTGESGEDAGKKILTIVNGRRVQLSANIYEQDLKQIQPGQQVQVKLNGFPDRTFAGQISVIGTTVEGETQVIPVKAELDNPSGVLKPGMFAELEILTAQTPVAVLTIPESALIKTNDNRTIVFVQNGNAFQPVEVTLGRASGDLIEIKSGLFDGDRVVTQRATQLYAQSLRSGVAPAAEHEAPAPADPSHQTEQLPWWVVLSTGGAIAAVTFWAGIYWANRQHRQRFTPLRNGHEYDLANPTHGAAAESTLPYGLPERLPRYDQINAESKSPHPPH